MPVVHRGYIRLLDTLRKRKVRKIYILDEKLIRSLSEQKPDIASLKSAEIRKFLINFGFKNIAILNSKNIRTVQDESIILIDDEISKKLHSKYFATKKVKWQKIFLRWDKSKVISATNVKCPVTKSSENISFMKEAYFEADKSSDWWRQVGAILVRDGKILLRAYNKGMPDDHAPYKYGAIRDFMNVGEKPELSSTIHAEQLIISTASKKGISTRGASLYVTHFPCAVCAKLISAAGISTCFFAEGSSNSDGEVVLKSANTNLIKVSIQNRI
jgi:dCMP deaminase